MGNYIYFLFTNSNDINNISILNANISVNIDITIYQHLKSTIAIEPCCWCTIVLPIGVISNSHVVM